MNGRPGGGAFGTVSGDGASAVYTAPQFEPTPNVVAVSAVVDYGKKPGVALLVSNITVVGGDSWTGTATYKNRYDSASAQITWILLSRDNNLAMYKATGIATIASDTGECSYPETSGSYATFGGGLMFVDFNNTPPTFHGGSIAGGWLVTVTCKKDGTRVLPAALPVFGGTGGPEGVEAVGSVTVPLNPETPMTIEGNSTDGLDGVYKWKFTRNP